MKKFTKEFIHNYKELGSLQKGTYGTPAYTRYVNRWLGRVFASAFGCFNASPNGVSILSSLITLFSFVAFWVIDKINLQAAIFLTILLVIGYALDSADGQLARLLKKQSKKGEWLDHTLDALKIPFGHGTAIFLIVNNITLNNYFLIFYLLLLSLSSAKFFSNTLKTKLIDYKRHGKNKTGGNTLIYRSVLLLPGDYGFFMGLFVLTFNPYLFYVAYTLWGSIIFLTSIVSLLRTWQAFDSKTANV